MQASRASNKILDEEMMTEDLKVQGGYSIDIIAEAVGKGQSKNSKMSRSAETSHVIEAIRECQMSFFRQIPSGACQNCGAHNPTIKRCVHLTLSALCKSRCLQPHLLTNAKL